MEFYHDLFNFGGRIEFQATVKRKNSRDSPLMALEDTYTLIHRFIDGKVEEEASTGGILEKLKMIGDLPHGLFMTDGIFSKRE